MIYYFEGEKAGRMSWIDLGEAIKLLYNVQHNADIDGFPSEFEFTYFKGWRGGVSGLEFTVKETTQTQSEKEPLHLTVEDIKMLILQYHASTGLIQQKPIKDILPYYKDGKFVGVRLVEY